MAGSGVVVPGPMMVALPQPALMPSRAAAAVREPPSAAAALHPMVAAGRLKPQALVTATVPLEETWPVLESMENFATTGFVVIDRY